MSANLYDFRKGDTVSIKSLNEEDQTKLFTFIEARARTAYFDKYRRELTQDKVAGQFGKRVEFIVKTVGLTKKNTEFVWIFGKDDAFISFPVQMRYLNLISRKSRHPVTNIFSVKNPQFDDVSVKEAKTNSVFEKVFEKS